MEDETKCDVCQKPAQQKCAGCHTVYYCTREHQKVGWKKHKKECKPFKICEDAVLGRYLVATKPLKPGDLLLKEPPLIWGPAQITVPVCLGCGKLVTQKNCKPCKKCGWPMCSEICQNSPSHIPECSYTVKRGDKISIKHFNITHPNYQCITVLRCLYQKQFLPDVWNKIEKLESHCEDRKATNAYENDKRNIADFIKRFFKLDKFTDEEIIKVCGIVMVNGHEVPLNEPSHVAIYEQASMLEHNCRANCCKSFRSNGDIIISVGTNIEKGEHLSICYTDPLWGTPNRRHHLHETKFFWCTCKRCSDPTEFGTYFSAMRCKEEECKGFMLPKTFLQSTTEMSSSTWYCDTCSAEISECELLDILEDIGKRLNSMPKGILGICKVFLRDTAHYLPKNHYYLTDVKFALCQLIGENPKLSEVPDEDLEFKTRMCNELLDVVRVLVPAEKRILGIILFELHAAIAELGRRNVQNGLSGPEQLKVALLESLKILHEVVDLLKYEPIELPEGKIREQAQRNMQEIDTILRTVHAKMGDDII